MREKYKECAECGTSFSLLFKNCNSKYCSEECRKEVRRRVNKNNKEKHKARMRFGGLDYIAEHTFKKYKRRSTSRGLNFELTLDFFKEQIKKPCYYCGETYKGIGFDRKDNSIGYIEHNVVPCCGGCNMMKRIDTVEAFIERCKKVAKNFS